MKDLVSGGKPLIILLLITIATMFVQNLTGISVAALFDMEAASRLLSARVSLIGGHSAAIAWSPRIAENHGVVGATPGLIPASLMGGPIAKFLIKRHELEPESV